VAELADALDLGSSELTRGGSNPPSRTMLNLPHQGNIYPVLNGSGYAGGT
jgi:hypothetical protein